MLIAYLCLSKYGIGNEFLPLAIPIKQTSIEYPHTRCMSFTQNNMCATFIRLAWSRTTTVKNPNDKSLYVKRI